MRPLLSDGREVRSEKSFPMTLTLGDPVPDLTFLRPDGTPVRLSELDARALVLIFLRHLA